MNESLLEFHMAVAIACLRGVWVAFALFTPSLAASFSYPASPVLLEPAISVQADLFRIYFSEIKDIQAKLPGGLGPDLSKALLSSVIHLRNLKMSEEMRKYPSHLMDGRWGRSSFITREHAQFILDSIASHPVVGYASLQRYDPDQEVGFCFGRAAYVHIELLRRGVDPQSIGKIFALGNLRSRRRRWDFHVATVVKGPDQEWWVIDDLVKRVLAVEDWMRETERLDWRPSRPQVRFYFTDATKFQPIHGAYTKKYLNLPYFRGYFTDLSKWFDSHPIAARDRFGEKGGK